MAELIIALDTSDPYQVEDLMKALKGRKVWIKLGLEALSAFGYQVIERIAEQDFKVFSDTKFHDIPNTVGAATRVLCGMGPSMFTVHCAGGAAMIRAARKESAEEAARHALRRPLVVGVTVLTSLSQDDFRTVGFEGTPVDAALAMAKMGKDSGLDGVVCSVHEAPAIRKAMGRDFLVVCPGIRPRDASVQDQKRVATPSEAIRAGANFLVVGRPVTQSDSPGEACDRILEEMRRVE